MILNLVQALYLSFLLVPPGCFVFPEYQEWSGVTLCVEMCAVEQSDSTPFALNALPASVITDHLSVKVIFFRWYQLYLRINVLSTVCVLFRLQENHWKKEMINI